MRYIFIKFICIFMLLLSFDAAFAQENDSIQEIVVESNVSYIRDLVLNQSGLKVGNTLSRDSASEAIKRLWNLELFRDISITNEQLEDGYKIIIKIEVLPETRLVTTEGFKEYDEEEILNAIELVRGKMVGERKVTKMEKKILDMYHDKGFLMAKVDFELNLFPDDSTKVDIKISMNEGKKVKIKSISIEGNQNISDRRLLKIMETKAHRWFRSGEYKEDVLEEDKMLIVSMYKTRGFRDAVVLRDSLFYGEEDDKINMIIYVNEGKEYKFGETTIEGNTHFTDEELLAYITFENGDIFNEGFIEKARYDITVDYNNEGYLQAMIQAVQYAHGDTVDIQFDIAEWNISKIAKVIIEGNTKTHEKIVRREITLLPGMAFNRDKLERSHREIMALNYFDPGGVNIDYEPAERENEVNIKIKVTEKSTGIAQMGAGYSERDRLVGTLAFSNSNLFGRGQGINFNWDMGTRRKSFQVGFTEPWLLDTPTIFSASLYDIVRSDYTSAFDQEKRRGGYMRLGRELKWPDYTRAYLTYRLEDVNYANPSAYYQQYLMTGKTSSLSVSFNRDSTDMPQFASKGTKMYAMFELAGGPFGGDLSYYKYFFHNEVYFPIFWKFSLVSRTRLGYLRGYKQNTWVPYSERFMPGGTSFDGIVRGYPDRQVCPRVSGEEIGGETMFVNNIELQFPIVANMVYGITFYDFGNAWSDLSETNPFDTKQSAGVGVRIFVPQIGLVGFDFGYGFDKLDGSTRIGGWRTHFQFGNFNNPMYY
ncbi:outer membrane protein assembly factor BamA [Candidatus Latescibacterota bacterium]